jgi:hypothetical protein
VAAIAALVAEGALNQNNQALCTVKNVSRTGIGLETGQPPLAGQSVIVRLALGDEMHEMRARAMRVRRRGTSSFYDVGLDWSGCSPVQLTFLDKVLEVVEQQPQS